MALSSWLEEMKRRRVFRALIAYGIVAFAVLQVIEPVMHGLSLPDWVLKATVLALGIGFPVTLVLAWAFDIKGGRIEAAGAPRGRGLAILVILGVALAAPGTAWFLWRNSPAAPPAGPPSIAVLPFADLSPAKDLDWMCDGIAEEIVDALFTVSGLRVAARSSSFQFKGKSIDVREMARALGVSTLLEGSVRKVGDRLRVSARLVSSDGYELWTDKFDRGASDAFAIQEEIARSVVAALRLRTEGPGQKRTGTTNEQAYEMYLRGRQYFRALGRQNSELGMQMFRRAVALDPKFAQAHAGLADAGSLLLLWRLIPPAEQPAVRAEVLKEAEEALRLDPSIAEAHVAHANVLYFLGRPAEADASFRRATALSPGARDTWYYYGRFLYSVGRYAEAATAFETAARTNPDDYDSLVMLAMQKSRMNDRAGSLEALRASLAAADRVLKIQPDDVRALYSSAGAMVQLGQVKEGLERIDQAVAIDPANFSVLYNAACSYARAGYAEKALDLLDRSVGTGQGYRAWIDHDPDLDSIRSHPRYAQIIARLPP